MPPHVTTARQAEAPVRGAMSGPARSLPVWGAAIGDPAHPCAPLRWPETTPFLPEERIDLRDAIAAFTLNATYVNFQDDRTVSIEAGKLADLVAVDRNLFAIPPDPISESKVLLTLLGGKPVYDDFTLAAPAAERDTPRQGN